MEALGRRAALAGLLGIAGTSCAPPGHAQQDSYPNKPIRAVIGYPAGGITDVTARLILNEMEPLLGQGFVVDNRGDASGAIGASIAAKAPADGYTLYFVIASHTILPATMGRQLQYDTVKDFAAVAQISSTPNLFVVRADSKLNSLQDLIDAAKQAPGKLSYGSVGYGTTVHITAALFEQATGTKLMHVPYKSSVTSTEAVISGEVVLGASSVFTGGQTVREGRLKALAVVGDHRFVSLPSVPTFKELGYPDIVGDSWMGLLAPAGTPPAIIKKLRDTLVQVLERPEMQARLLAMGAEVVASTSEQFQKRIEHEVAAFKALGEKVPLTPE
jgi:tripartite-type tricarboxylate transporter receptor subunit TctC